MIRSLDEAKTDLDSYREPFYECVRAALEAYVRDHAPFRHYYCQRTQACIIHDLMKFQVKTRFHGKQGVVIRDKGNLFTVGVDGKYLIKLKKLDLRLRARNIPTQAALNFQWQQLELPDLPAATNINIGYQPPNGSELMTSKIWVICPDGFDVAWSWELPRPVPVVSIAPVLPSKAEPTNLVPRTMLAEPIGRAPRVVARAEKKKEKPEPNNEKKRTGDGPSDD